MNIAQLFLKTIPARGSQIQLFTNRIQVDFNSDAWIHLKRLFHSLKSSAIMAGFSDLSTLAKLAEKSAEKQTNVQAIDNFGKLLESGADHPETLKADNVRYQEIIKQLTVSMVKPITVFITDDDIFIAEIIQISLEMDGEYSIHTSQTGEETLVLLKKFVPDIIILDLNLEDMDGIDLMTRIKKYHGMKSIPVIVLTGNDEPGIRRKALQAGASAFVQKPFMPQKLVDRINQLVIMEK